MKAKVKFTAMLQNPTGMWEDEQVIEYPDPSYRSAAVLQSYATFKQAANAIGLITTVDATELNVIPWHRVQSVNVKLTEVLLADNLDMAKAVAAKGLITP